MAKLVYFKLFITELTNVINVIKTVVDAIILSVLLKAFHLIKIKMSTPMKNSRNPKLFKKDDRLKISDNAIKLKPVNVLKAPIKLFLFINVYLKEERMLWDLPLYMMLMHPE